MITDRASTTNKAADDRQHDLVLGADRNRPQRAAQRQRPGVAHEDRRRRGVVPQEPEARPEKGRGEDHQSSDVPGT